MNHFDPMILTENKSADADDFFYNILFGDGQVRFYLFPKEMHSYREYLNQPGDAECLAEKLPWATAMTLEGVVK